MSALTFIRGDVAFFDKVLAEGRVEYKLTYVRLVRQLSLLGAIVSVPPAEAKVNLFAALERSDLVAYQR
ncbi:MAG: hypothetical protein ABF243_11925 [Celeribacter marinus]